ncbi:uncharacterized protein LOC143021180 [Oratosquilla oratoria]|uniref:uncharacterized protein LOC143021180 n=1 Tax=Oratosquilla oratoria TaxID=337810 RepID=UPI003F774C10
MFRKSDGSYRMAIDYRQLNAVTVFHAEPIGLNTVRHLGLLLDMIRSHHLTLKISKCRFGFPAIQYLGFILGGDCLQPQPDKVEALCRVPPPSTKKLLCSFLGMVGFYKMFIPQAADYTGPLSNLPRKTVREPLPWTEELQSLFNHLKLVLSSNPVLRLPDSSLTFVLRTDASNHGLGAVLLLLDRESRYFTNERECLVVVFGIQRFDYYLRGREFVLEVNHKPLTYLHTFKGNGVERNMCQHEATRLGMAHCGQKVHAYTDRLARSTTGDTGCHLL